MIHQTTTSSPSLIQQMLERGMEGLNSPAPAIEGSTLPGAATSSPPTYLTPDAIMAYCQSRLQSIDGQVETAMTQQQNCNNEQTAVQSVLTQISNLQSELSGDPPTVTDHATAVSIEQDLEKLISQMETTDPSNSQIPTLKQLHDTMMATGCGPNNGAGGYYCSSPADLPAGATPTGKTAPTDAPWKDVNDNFGADELTNFSQTLTGVNNALNNSAEMGMISIQSLMSQRTTAIQLSTNILQSMDDGMSKIVDNVGH